MMLDHSNPRLTLATPSTFPHTAEAVVRALGRNPGRSLLLTGIVRKINGLMTKKKVLEYFRATAVIDGSDTDLEEIAEIDTKIKAAAEEQRLYEQRVLDEGLGAVREAKAKEAEVKKAEVEKAKAKAAEVQKAQAAEREAVVCKAEKAVMAAEAMRVVRHSFTHIALEGGGTRELTREVSSPCTIFSC